MRELKPGEIVFRNYEIARPIGQGSLVQAFLCNDLQESGNQVTVKILWEDFQNDSDVVKRIKRWIDYFSAVSHPNLVQVFELHEHKGLLGYATEYVEAENLETILERSPAPEKIAPIFTQATAAVEVIHENGMIHRNLKSKKILVSSANQVKVMESTVGYAPNDTSVQEEPGSVLGTIDYIAPEYMLNSELDQRADIYGLGVIMYELATGKSPFLGDSLYETMTSRLKCHPIPPHEVNPDCSEALSEIILKAMYLESDARYQTALELKQALENLDS